MKKLIISVFLATSILSCQNDKKETKETVIHELEKVDNTEKIERVFEQFKSLYKELIEFKDKDIFKQYGFGQGGPYNGWLRKVEELEQLPDSKLLLEKGIIAGELKSLGMEYVNSKGQETKVTKRFNKIFSDAIRTEPVEEIENASGNSNYDNIKSEYELFGKWQINNSLSKSSYQYEIYKKGTEFIGVIPEYDYRTEVIEKKGSDYHVKGSEYGEFYRLDANKNMTLFDTDGDLSSAGYKATKK